MENLSPLCKWHLPPKNSPESTCKSNSVNLLGRRKQGHFKCRTTCPLPIAIKIRHTQCKRWSKEYMVPLLRKATERAEQQLQSIAATLRRAAGRQTRKKPEITQKSPTCLLPHPVLECSFSSQSVTGRPG